MRNASPRKMIDIVHPIIKPANYVVPRPRPDVVSIVQCFMNCRMSYMLAGLTELCRAFNVDVAIEPKGTIILFINTPMNYLKFFVCNETDNPIIVAYKLAAGRSIGSYDQLHAIMQGITETMKSAARVEFSTVVEKALKTYEVDKWGYEAK